ncbi:MAG TPA: VgrG-related protein [Actinomycetota bacterium]|nr:VgrG-related protein [Actinomycetota bacterium]
MAERRLDAAALTVDGADLAEALYDVLALVRVEESVHLPDAFALRFDDPHFDLFDKGTFSLGTKVDIAFSSEQELVTVTRGEVTAMTVEPGPGGRHQLVVTGLDATHRLARGPKTRSFQNMTDADIVSTIARDYDLDTDVDATPEVYEYVLQHSQTDYAFLRDRGERIGFDLYVADGTLYFKRHPESRESPPSLTWGDNLQSFRVRFSAAERCDEVTVRGWDPKNKATIVGRSDQGDTGSTASASSDLSDSAQRAFGRVSRFAGQFPVSTQQEADALARSLLLKASGDEVVLKGEARGDPMIAAGAEVEIAEVGDRLSGSYLVTSVEHVYGGDAAYVTRFVCGGKEPAFLADLVSAGGNGSGQKRGWGSLVIGLVTNCDDPEQRGRVKVKFPTLSDKDESAWARVCSPGAGPDRGLQLVPEVNDEVLVGFEHDDKQRPVVIGGLWNGADYTPKAKVDGGRVQTRVWKSRKEHLFEFDDGDDDPAITLTHGTAATSLHLEKESSRLAAEDKLAITADSIEITANSKLRIKAASIEIEADGDVSVKGSVIKLN